MFTVIKYPTDCISFGVCWYTEIDELWTKLVADGGQKSMCGWLKDKYALSWQIVPVQMGELFEDKNREKAGRSMQAMMKMKKLDIAKLKEAFNG